MVSTLELRCAAQHSTENVQNVRVWNLKRPARHWQLSNTPPAPWACISNSRATPARHGLACRGASSFKYWVMFPMQKTYGGSFCLFLQNANYQNSTLKRHFLLIRQITIKSFLDAIMLQDNKDYKQLALLPVTIINIQLCDLRDLALDKAPFQGTWGSLCSLWKPYTSSSKATCYWWHIFSSGAQKEKLCLRLSALFTLLPVI